MGTLGIYKIAVDTAAIADGHSIAAYLTDAAGSLLTSTSLGGKQRLDVITASEFAEDSAHVSGDYGTQVLAVRNDTEGSLAGTNGDYAPLQVDALGRLRVNADININNDFVFAEDSAASSGALGASVLGVRQDTLATDTSDDGDYSWFKMTALGELYVHDTDALAQLVTIDASLGTIDASVQSVLAELQSITFAEDSGHTTGDAGVMALAVRNDANVALTSTDLDYSPIATDSAGRVKITGAITVAGQYAEDSAHVSGDIGLFGLSVRSDANGALAGTSGDYAPFLTSSVGDLKVVDRADGTNLQQVVAVGDTATQLPAANLAGRKHIVLQNRGSKPVYLGSATVTADDTATGGIMVPKSGFWEGDVGPGNALYGIAPTGETINVAVWELS